MKFLDLFKTSSEANSNSRVLRTRPTDDFADSILLELKSVASEAIKNALEERENKYMKSILDESYFLLDSLIIIPKDREIAKRFDDFLTTHESVDSDFRHHFFNKCCSANSAHCAEELYACHQISLLRFNWVKPH